MSTFTSTVSYRSAGANVSARTPGKTAVKPGLLARLWKSLLESRQRAAALELQRHGLRLPRELEEVGWKITERNEDSLPFVR